MSLYHYVKTQIKFVTAQFIINLKLQFEKSTIIVFRNLNYGSGFQTRVNSRASLKIL